MNEQTGKLVIRMSFETTASRFWTMTVHTKHYVTREEARLEVKEWLKLNDRVRQEDISANWSFDENIWI